MILCAVLIYGFFYNAVSSRDESDTDTSASKKEDNEQEEEEMPQKNLPASTLSPMSVPKGPSSKLIHYWPCINVLISYSDMICYTADNNGIN